MKIRKIALASLFTSTALLTACVSDDYGQQEDYYKLWSSSKKCIVTKSLQPVIRICVHGSGDLARSRDLVRESMRQWLNAVRPLHSGVTDQVEFSCDNPHGYVRVRGGSGRAFASPGKTTVYNKSNLGTYLHEFGHAFACLGDTYRNATAGKCQSGQPNSIMCDGMLRKELAQDDINGVQAQFKRLVGKPENPDIPPMDPKDNDSDGVPNELDLCPKTPIGSHVHGPGEYYGCAESQLGGDTDEDVIVDDDSDGVANEDDRCPNTKADAWVWTDQHDGKWKGCAPGEVPAAADDDGDGVPNKYDRCPKTKAGAWVWEDQYNGKWKGCAPGEVPSA